MNELILQGWPKNHLGRRSRLEMKVDEEQSSLKVGQQNSKDEIQASEVRLRLWKSSEKHKHEMLNIKPGDVCLYFF